MSVIWLFVACGILGLLYAMDAVGMANSFRVRDGGADSGEKRRTQRPWSRFAIAAGVCVPYGFVLAPVLIFAIFLGGIFGIMYTSYKVNKGVKTGELRSVSLLTYFAFLLFGAVMWGYKALVVVFTPMAAVLRKVGAISPRKP